MGRQHFPASSLADAWVVSQRARQLHGQAQAAPSSGTSAAGGKAGGGREWTRDHTRESDRDRVESTKARTRSAIKRQRVAVVESALANVDVVSHLASFLEAKDLCQV